MTHGLESIIRKVESLSWPKFLLLAFGTTTLLKVLILPPVGALTGQEARAANVQVLNDLSTGQMSPIGAILTLAVLVPLIETVIGKESEPG